MKSTKVQHSLDQREIDDERKTVKELVGYSIEALDKATDALEQIQRIQEQLGAVNAVNMVRNGDFRHGVESWRVMNGHPTIQQGVLNVNSTGVSSQIRQDYSLVVGHLYYVCMKVRVSRYVAGTLGYQFIGMGTTIHGEKEIIEDFELYANIHRAISPDGRLYVGGLSQANLDGDIKEVLVVNLTETFGEGQEPSEQEFEHLLKGFPYNWFDGKVSLVRFKESYEMTRKETLSISEVEAKAAFIKEMNKKAQQIGMKHTHFINAHGLGIEGQVSTSRDLMLMTIHATGYSDLLKVWNKKKYMIKVQGENARNLVIKTSVVGASLDHHYHVFGGKTGTLIGTTGQRTKNLVVLVNAPHNNWFVGSLMEAGADRFLAAKQLFDIAKIYYEGGTPNKHVFSANKGAVCLMPKHHPFAYENYDIPLLWGKDPDEIGYPASATKVMTAMVLLDYVKDLNEKVHLKNSDLTRGTGPAFRVDDVVTMKDALFSMMLPSSNTMAETVARVVGEKIIRSRR